MSILSNLKGWAARSPAVSALLQPVHTGYRHLVMRSAQRRLGINPQKVVFSSFQGQSYSDNPRYISEKLHELCPEAQIVWLFREGRLDAAQTPPYVKKGLLVSREGLIEQATARFWVDNFARSASLYLNTDAQYYINTWHGDRGFKRVADDNEKGRAGVRRLEEKCAMMIAGSEFGRNTYRTGLRFRGEVLMDGCPRNDILLRADPAEAAAVRARLGVEEGVRLLIYAPTYRDDRENARQDAVLDVSRALDHLEKRTGMPWRCLYRAHYKNAGLNVRADARVRDVSGWPEMAELLLVSDMLITDYSSCGSDFVLQRRPMFLYQPDVDDYLRNSRSFYFDMADSPFLIARNMDELEALMDRTDAAAARANGEAIDRFFGTTETGRASEAVCRYIMERMG